MKYFKNILTSLGILALGLGPVQSAEDTFSLRTLDPGTLGSSQSFIIHAPDGTVVEVSNPFGSDVLSPGLHGLHFPTRLELKNLTVKENFPVKENAFDG